MGRNTEEHDDVYEVLASHLTALGHPARLELLNALRQPRVLREIHVRPRRSSEGENPDRPMSRTAVERHLAVLTAAGVIGRREASRSGRSVQEYALQHARLFQLVEELRAIAALRPVDPLALEETVLDVSAVAPPRIRGPHMVLLSGPAEGRALALDGEGPWVLGRADRSDVALDYDPYVSSEHARVTATQEGYHLEDTGLSRNGTFLNWHPVPTGTAAPLLSGDVLRLGRSLLLFRGDPRSP